jgi:hypothetical protein
MEHGASGQGRLPLVLVGPMATISTMSITTVPH